MAVVGDLTKDQGKTQTIAALISSVADACRTSRHSAARMAKTTVRRGGSTERRPSPDHDCRVIGDQTHGDGAGADGLNDEGFVQC